MMFIKPLLFGITAFVRMLAIYSGVVSLISGMRFALEQFTKFWYFIVAFAPGKGQIYCCFDLELESLRPRRNNQHEIAVIKSDPGTLMYPRIEKAG